MTTKTRDKFVDLIEEVDEYIFEKVTDLLKKPYDSKSYFWDKLNTLIAFRDAYQKNLGV